MRYLDERLSRMFDTIKKYQKHLDDASVIDVESPFIASVDAMVSTLIDTTAENLIMFYPEIAVTFTMDEVIDLLLEHFNGDCSLDELVIRLSVNVEDIT